MPPQAVEHLNIMPVGIERRINMKLLGIELTDKEFDYLMCEQTKGKELKVVGGKVVAVEKTLTESEKSLIRIRELKQLLNQSDYQTLKFIEGQITTEEYEPIKLQRQAWRAEINLLQNK
jgi:hypothetical protein